MDIVKQVKDKKEIGDILDICKIANEKFTKEELLFFTFAYMYHNFGGHKEKVLKVIEEYKMINKNKQKK